MAHPRYTWNPLGQIVCHVRDNPGTNIVDLLPYTRLPYDPDIPEPQGLDLFSKGLAEARINKAWIANKYLLTKIAKMEYEMPESESGDESESGEVDKESQSDDESQCSEVNWESNLMVAKRRKETPKT